MRMFAVLLLIGAVTLIAGTLPQKPVDTSVWPVDPMYAGIDADALVTDLRGPMPYVDWDCKPGHPGKGLGHCKPWAPGPAPSETPEPGTLGLMAAGAMLLAVGVYRRRNV